MIKIESLSSKKREISSAELERRMVASIEKILGEWGDDVDTILRDALQKRRIEDTGRLRSSIKHAVAAKTTKDITIAHNFADAGRYLDMRGLAWKSSPPPLTKQGDKSGGIYDWVLRNKKYVSKYTPGYKNKTPQTNKDYMRIAYAVSKSFVGRKKRRAKRWYVKNYWSKLPDLINAILDDLIQEQIIKEFKNLGDGK